MAEAAEATARFDNQLAEEGQLPSRSFLFTSGNKIQVNVKLPIKLHQALSFYQGVIYAMTAKKPEISELVNEATTEYLISKHYSPTSPPPVERRALKSIIPEGVVDEYATKDVPVMQ